MQKASVESSILLPNYASSKESSGAEELRPSRPRENQLFGPPQKTPSRVPCASPRALKLNTRVPPCREYPVRLLAVSCARFPQSSGLTRVGIQKRRLIGAVVLLE